MTFQVCLDFILGQNYAGKGSDGDGSLTYSINTPDGTELLAATNAGLTEVGGPGTSGSYKLAVTANTTWAGDFSRVFFYDNGTLLPWVIGRIELVTMRAIDAIPTTGTGPFTRTVTVLDENSDPIVGADVGMSGGFADVTDSNGQVVFRHVSGTYTITAAADGYLGATSGAIALTADGTTELTMAGNGITASADPAQCTCYCTTRDGRGNAVGSITLKFALVDPFPTGDTSDAWDRTNFTATSDAGTALLQVDLKRGGKYHAKWDGGGWVDFTVPDAATYELPEILSKAGS